MKFECYGNNPQMYATNLRQDKNSKKLRWDSTNGADALIVQTAYGEAVDMEKLCRGLEEKVGEIEMLQGKYIKVLPTVWCRYVSSVEKAKNNGCAINGEPATYTVYACVFDRGTDTIRIYPSQNSGMIKPSCDIQVRIHIDIVREMELKRKGREVETGFYSLNFPEAPYAGYMDGDLYYSIGRLPDGDFEIPITKEMIAQKKVYVKTDIMPEVKPRNKGLRLS